MTGRRTDDEGRAVVALDDCDFHTVAGADRASGAHWYAVSVPCAAGTVG
jgi:hypothetical protein